MDSIWCMVIHPISWESIYHISVYICIYIYIYIAMNICEIPMKMDSSPWHPWHAWPDPSGSQPRGLGISSCRLDHSPNCNRPLENPLFLWENHRKTIGKWSGCWKQRCPNLKYLNLAEIQRNRELLWVRSPAPCPSSDVQHSSRLVCWVQPISLRIFRFQIQLSRNSQEATKMKAASETPRASIPIFGWMCVWKYG